MYWLLTPKSKRRKCLFNKSCSNYVFEKTISEGLFSGLKALKFRINNCNPNYSIIELNGEQVLVSKTHQIFKEEELRNSILK